MTYKMLNKKGNRDKVMTIVIRLEIHRIKQAIFKKLTLMHSFIKYKCI